MKCGLLSATIARYGGCSGWKKPLQDLPLRLKKRVPARVKQILVVPATANVCWSLDFTSNVLADGHQFCTLNVLNDDNRQLLGVVIDFSLPASRIV